MDNVRYLDMKKSNVWSKQVEVGQKVVLPPFMKIFIQKHEVMQI